MLSWDDYEENLGTASTETQREVAARRSFLDAAPPATVPSIPEPIPSAAVTTVAEMPTPAPMPPPAPPALAPAPRGTVDRRRRPSGGERR